MSFGLSCGLPIFPNVTEKPAYVQLLEQKLDISINDSQQIAFTACRTTGVQLSNGQTVAYDHVVTNLGGGYDTNQFQFSAPLSGLYQFTVTVMSGMNTIIHLRIVKNGSELVKVFSTGHWDETGTNVVNVHLHKNDRVWVQAMDTSSSLEGGFGYNCFSGNLIQADV
ncbi:hypothetical protein FSP39_001681 [Pinctada imbricata]|uniref:C1q domain-containing protein n=1 Tax=Pinctada imbricata TaxID=66713 RepID=A0AA88YAG9_PINIB|nr:hypothetical protein FSP39_001681 [Pinctada imbricata]